MLTDAELLAIWERGASVYYKDHFAFARAVCLAEREQRGKVSEHDPKPSAWAMVFEGCNGSGDWAELGAEIPIPERGFTAHPLYDRATLEDAVSAERERCAKDCEAFNDGGGAGEAWAQRYADHVRSGQ